MSKPEPETKIAVRPASPIPSRGTASILPYELDPELAQLKIVELMVNRLPLPTIVSKPYIVRYGIFSALNHTANNRTGYDCSTRLHVYEKVGAHSINIEGEYFRSFWAWANKPKFVLSGNVGMPGQFEEPKEGVLSRLVNWIRGGNKNQTPSQGVRQ
jgi:hypothetical protein